MASSYGQSDLIFRAVKNQILFSEDLKSQFKIRKDFIEGKNHSLFKKIYNSPSFEFRKYGDFTFDCG